MISLNDDDVNFNYDEVSEKSSNSGCNCNDDIGTTDYIGDLNSKIYKIIAIEKN